MCLADQSLFLINKTYAYITFTKNNQSKNISLEGKKIRNSDAYQPGGSNVNFVEIISNNTIDVRTYERGVEAETLSCGTGVTASALVAALHGIQSPTKIQTKGGDLEVSFTQKSPNHFCDIILSGPAVMTFKGEVEI